MSTYRHPANPDRARAMTELRRSGASGPHQDRRTRRGRTRGAAARRAIADAS